MRPALSFLLAIAFLPAAGGEILAQTIHGQVVESGTGIPVARVFVVLLDEEAVRRAATLADSTGRFSLGAPSPGRYTLLAQRIGYTSSVSSVLELAAGQTLRYRFEVNVEPVTLEGISAAGDTGCRLRPEAGVETQRLWGEARKALDVAAWRANQGVVYQSNVYERTRDVISLEILEHEGRLHSQYGSTVAYSEPAEDLATHGYVRSLPEETYQYFGVDAHTLLSDAFLDTHCFRVRQPRSEDEEGLIGLAFEPLPNHYRPDITGALWLDRTTSELRHLKFEFTQHLYDVPVPSEPFGGRLDFRQLSNGAWIVDHWWLRMPQVNTIINPSGPNTPMTRNVRPTDGARESLLGARQIGLRIREKGGEVLFIARPGSRVASAGATIEGVVYDSAHGAPIAGATVFVTGADRRARTNARGRFRIVGLPEGIDEVGFFHPYTDALALIVELREVQLKRGSTTSITLFIPRTMGCPDPPGESRTGTIVGYAYDAMNGKPLSRARISADWKDVAVEADDRGRFVICNVPVGTSVRLQAHFRNNRGPAFRILVDHPAVMRQDLLWK